MWAAGLKRIERKIDHRLRQLQDAQTSVLDVPEQVTLPPCRLVWMETSLQIHHFLDMEAPIRSLEQSGTEALIFLGKVGVGISTEHLRQKNFGGYDGIFLVLDEEDHFKGQTITLAETPCVRVRFRGSHAQAPAHYEMLYNTSKPGIGNCEFCPEITLIDFGLTGNTENS
ncbi:MAG: hypothetical protein ACLUO4_06005 [Christensenellales bacterium]